MKMKNLLFLLGFVFMLSCNEKTIEPPANLIGKDKMVDILYDLAIINASKGINATVLEQHGIDPMPYIFEKHNIDSLQFVKSDVYYASLPREYETIYKRLSARLEKEREILEEHKKQKQDSIKEVQEEKRKAKISGK